MSQQPVGDVDWWRETVIYQIYPASFKDTTGNGMGDINGIRQSLDYLLQIGVRAVWITPVCLSPMKDMGYDVSDYKTVNPIFGTNDDLKCLVEDMHSRNMYLIMDMVVNHTSDQHPWFQASLAGEKPYDDYYIWKEGSRQKGSDVLRAPNNWESVFGGPAWTWSEMRNKYYLHTFLPQQPDLNYRNPEVCREMLEVFKYWLDLGVDGFRLDAVIYLMKDKMFRNNPLTARASGCRPGMHDRYGLTKPVHNVNQHDTYVLVKTWTDFFRRYGQANNKKILTITEGYADLPYVLKYYEYGVDLPMNFGLMDWNDGLGSFEMKTVISEWLHNMPRNVCANWVVSNHDNPRILSRLRNKRMYANLVNALLLLLPGTAICYYGDELGMCDVQVAYSQIKDTSVMHLNALEAARLTRDGCRAPMAWTSDEPYAGFTNCADGAWLPMAPRPDLYSVEAQLTVPCSYLNNFISLMKIRQLPTFAKSMSLRFVVHDEDVLVFVRELAKHPSYIVIINLKPPTTQRVCLDLSLVDPEVKTAQVVYDSRRMYSFHETVPIDRVYMCSAQAAVLSFMPSRSPPSFE